MSEFRVRISVSSKESLVLIKEKLVLSKESEFQVRKS